MHNGAIPLLAMAFIGIVVVKRPVPSARVTSPRKCLEEALLYSIEMIEIKGRKDAFQPQRRCRIADLCSWARDRRKFENRHVKELSVSRISTFSDKKTEEGNFGYFALDFAFQSDQVV